MTRDETNDRGVPRAEEEANARNVEAWHLQFLAIGTAIGSGLFVGSAAGIHDAGSALLLAYAVCAILVYVVARALGELALARPDRPTFVHHVRAEVGPVAGLVSGWGFWLMTVTVGMAELTAVGLVGRTLLPGLPQWFLILAVFLALLPINLMPLRRFATVEAAMSAIKVFVILAFIGLAGAALLAPGSFPPGSGVANLLDPGGFAPYGWRGVGRAIPLALFAFGGIEVISLAAGDARNPTASIPKAVNGLIARFAIFFIGGTCALLILLPQSGFMPGISPFATILNGLHVPAAAVLISALLITCIFSSANAVLFAGARTLQALAQDGFAPKGFSVASGSGVPARALLVTACGTSAAIALNAAFPAAVFGMLMQGVGVFTVVNWMLILVAQMRHRARLGPGASPAFGMPCWPWPCVAALVLLPLALFVGILA